MYLKMLLEYLHFIHLAYEGYTINPVCFLADAGNHMMGTNHRKVFPI